MSPLAIREGVVNCLGAPWPEDLSPAFIDQLREQGVVVVGCTANETWDDTLESLENFATVKAIVRAHPHAYLVRRVADLDREENRGKLGVLLGLQNPKALSDSPRLIDTFFRSRTALFVVGFQRKQLLRLRPRKRSRHRPDDTRPPRHQAHE
jgi:microsomal dipeptidase-like Zn-dependent dipeptidase